MCRVVDSGYRIGNVAIYVYGKVDHRGGAIGNGANHVGVGVTTSGRPTRTAGGGVKGGIGGNSFRNPHPSCACVATVGVGQGVGDGVASFGGNTTITLGKLHSGGACMGDRG